jgi:CubicO group peptidase (beta-lactamase class C family)
MIVKGVCSPKFQEVQQVFQNLFNNKEEVGANFAVVQNNQVLINIFGGSKNSNEEWDENTIVNTFSLSKGIYASCVAKLIEEKELDIEKKVSFYWPEFKNNKENILVKNILSHQSGLYRFKKKITNDDLLDYDKIINILEKQTPDHLPGEKTYYHAKTHGYLVENLIRKITQKNIKEFFDENFSKKYELNFNFGFKKNDFNNTSDLIENILDPKIIKKDFDAFNNPEHDINFYNSKEWRLAGVPSMGGHGSALAVAQIYDLLANDLKSDNKNIISKNNFKTILQQSTKSLDKSLNLPIKWTYSGFILRGGSMFGKNKEAFGHNGWGGSVGFGDPIEGIGVAYVTRKINSSMKPDIRAIRLIKKFYEVLNYNI